MSTQHVLPTDFDGVSLADLDPGLLFQNRGRSTVYLCSAYPREVSQILMFMFKREDAKPGESPIGYRRNYKLAAVPKGAPPTILPISTTMTMVMQEMDHPSGERCMGQTPKPVFATTIAESLLNLWVKEASFSSHDAHPGIGIIASSKPTAEEIGNLMDRQSRYFQQIIHAGSQIWFSKDPDQVRQLRPGSLYRAAADYMGADVEWARDYATALSKRCIACGELISEKARACKHCNRNLLEWPFESGMSLAEIEAADPFIAAQPNVQKRYAAEAEPPRKAETIGEKARKAAAAKGAAQNDTPQQEF